VAGFVVNKFRKCIILSSKSGSRLCPVAGFVINKFRKCIILSSKSGSGLYPVAGFVVSSEPSGYATRVI
jgi:hypothetical protein